MGPRSFDRGKQCRLRFELRRRLRLQWGRDRLIAERASFIAAEARVLIASMGPRSFDRGKKKNTTEPKAMKKLQWGRDRLIAERPEEKDELIAAARLQWGRDRLIAESLEMFQDYATTNGFNGAAIV